MKQEFFFEGPEKKLEVFFSGAVLPEGLRTFGLPTWSQVVADAGCAVLHHKSNDSFDAYLLSESSLFVFPFRVVIKTCGQTTPLLALPQVPNAFPIGPHPHPHPDPPVLFPRHCLHPAELHTTPNRRHARRRWNDRH